MTFPAACRLDGGGAVARALGGVLAELGRGGGVPRKILFDQMRTVVIRDLRPEGGRLVENGGCQEEGRRVQISREPRVGEHRTLFRPRFSAADGIQAVGRTEADGWERRERAEGHRENTAEKEPVQTFAHLQHQPEDGYGLCTECESKIPLDRLLVFPETATCVRCSA